MCVCVCVCVCLCLCVCVWRCSAALRELAVWWEVLAYSMWHPNRFTPSHFVGDQLVAFMCHRFIPAQRKLYLGYHSLLFHNAMYCVSSNALPGCEQPRERTTSLRPAQSHGERISAPPVPNRFPWLEQKVHHLVWANVLTNISRQNNPV